MIEKKDDERIEIKEEELNKATGGYFRKTEIGKKSLIEKEDSGKKPNIHFPLQ